MPHVRDRLAAGLSPSPSFRHAVAWSDQLRADLRLVASGKCPGFSAVDAMLAGPLLRCAEGDFDEAERAIVGALGDHLDACHHDPEIFISFLHALFVVQRLDLVAALIKDRFRYPAPLSVSIEDGTIGAGGVRWDISPSGTHNFAFDAAVLRRDDTRLEILAFQWECPLLAHYAGQPDQEHGSVFINRQDIGTQPGLAYCDSRPDYFLIPDCIFVPSRGYAHARDVLAERRLPWRDRRSTAFWRGGTTGIPARPGEWRSLERIRLCEIARAHQATGLIDAGISSIVQIHDPDAAREIEASGLVRGRVPWEDWGQYKFLIDIDGNSSPWSNLFQRLLTGSVVLKVESSRGLMQWFYDDLKPWRNYVPVAPDMSDLMDKIAWLNRHDDFARALGEAGRQLAETLTYEHELERGAAVISSAFRYFRGDPGEAAPYGRVTRSERVPSSESGQNKGVLF